MSKLESHPLPPGADDEDDEGSEVHKGDGIEIKVTQKPGFLCHIRATANFNLSADRLFRQVGRGGVGQVGVGAATARSGGCGNCRGEAGRESG